MVVIGTIQIIQVEVPTEIPMRVMVTHVVLHLHEGPRHLMVEAVAMMITAAHVTDMVEVETVTQAAEVISTQVVAIGLADKKEGFLLLWKGGTLLHVIPTAVQAAEQGARSGLGKRLNSGAPEQPRCAGFATPLLLLQPSRLPSQLSPGQARPRETGERESLLGNARGGSRTAPVRGHPGPGPDPAVPPSSL